MVAFAFQGRADAALTTSRLPTETAALAIAGANGGAVRVTTEARIGGSGDWELGLRRDPGILNDGTSVTANFDAWLNGIPTPFLLAYDGRKTVAMTLLLSPVANRPAFSIVGDFNEIFIPTQAVGANTSIVVGNLFLNGVPIGGSSSAASTGTNAQDVLRIQDASLSKGFLLTGTITLRWKGPKPSGSRLDSQFWLAKVVAAPTDAIPPQLTITSPANLLATDNTSPPVAVTYSDQGSGVATGTLKLFLDDAEQVGACTAGAASATCRTSGLTEGMHLARVTIADRSGNLAKASSVFTVTADHDPPSLTVDAPAAGDLVGSPTQEVRLRYADAKSGVDLRTLTVALDGNNLVPGCLLNAADARCELQGLSPGAHVLTASLQDFARNLATAEVRFNLALERTAPQISVLEPNATKLVNQPPPELRVTYSDAGSGIRRDSVKVSLDGGDVTSACRVDRGMATCQPGALADGPHHLAASVADMAGNTAATAFDFTTATDREPPQIDLASPAEGAIVGSSPVHFAGRVSDDTGVAALVVGGRETAIAADGGFAADVEVGPGTSSVNLVAIDAAGRQTTLTRNVYLDVTPPRVQILSPASGSTVNGARVTIRGYATDDRLVSGVTVNGIPATMDRVFFTAQVSLQEGDNQIDVRARDGAGNEATTSLTMTRFSVPQVAITSPPANAVFRDPVIDVRGTIGPDVTAVEVNGVAATLSGGTFAATGVPLAEGLDTLSAVALNGSGRQGATSVGVFRDSTAPRLFVDAPADGEVVHESTLTVRGRVIDLVSGIGDPGRLDVTVNGVSAAVAAGTFLARVSVGPDVTAIVVQAVDGAGNTVETRRSVRYAAPAGPRAERVSGNGQQGVVGTALAEPLVVRLLDANGQPAPNQAVIFKVTGNDGLLNEGRRRVSVTTGPDGQASARLTLGQRAGMGTQSVEAASTGFGVPVVFLVDAKPATPHRALVDMGDQQVGVTGQPLPDPLVAVVADDSLNRIAGVRVLFRVVKGGGHLANGLPEMTVSTDAQGRAATVFVLGEDSGTANHVVEAVLADAIDSVGAAFTASGWSAGDPAATSVSGVVLDNADEPVPGATVHIADTPFTTQTDRRGYFKIAGAPVGYARLIVEGSSTTRPGTWPTLEFQLNLVPGRENTMGRPIYLLPIDEAHGLVVDETHGGTLTLPDVPGFALEIAPGSVTFPGGSRSGVVSVTVVHADKVPMAPSMGIQPRLVVTIQPPGARFDPPARLTFPNAAGLKPGETTEVFSFDHEMVRFVSIGTATVSEDGSVLAGDPGTGIVQAGWHWPCGGNSGATGTAHNCKTCLKCESARCVPDLEQEGHPCDDGNVCTIKDECMYDDSLPCLGYGPVFSRVVLKANGEGDLAVRSVDDEFVFTATPEGASCPAGTLQYHWDLGDGTKSTEVSPRHHYASPGLYEVDLKVACDLCPVTQGLGSMGVVAAKVSLQSVLNQSVSMDNPESDWSSATTLRSGVPVYSGDGNGDWVDYRAAIVPALARVRLQSLQWHAEGPAAQSGPAGKQADEWKIEGKGLDWKPGTYTLHVDATFQSGSVAQDHLDQKVGFRTQEYVVVGSLLAESVVPTAGVLPSTIDRFECPEIIARVVNGEFNDPSSFSYVPEQVPDRVYVNYRIINTSANLVPLDHLFPHGGDAGSYGLSDYGDYRMLSRAQFKYLAEGDALAATPEPVGTLLSKAGYTRPLCLAGIRGPALGIVHPSSGKFTGAPGDTQFFDLIQVRAGNEGQNGFLQLNRRELPWVFFRYRFDVPTGKLMTDFSASPSHDPDGPSDSDFSAEPTIYVFRRYYVRGDDYHMDLLGTRQGRLQDFLPVGRVIAQPAYP